VSKSIDGLLSSSSRDWRRVASALRSMPGGIVLRRIDRNGAAANVAFASIIGRVRCKMRNDRYKVAEALTFFALA
jgi:hypothetical protein